MANLLRESRDLLVTGDLKGSYEKLTAIIELCTTNQTVSDDTGSKRRHDVCMNEDNGHSECVPVLSREVLSDVYNSRGHIRYLWVDFNEAVEDYSRAIELNDGHCVAYYNRGQIHYRMGRYVEAEKDLLKALDINPDFEDAKLNLRQVQKDIATGHKFNTN